MSDRILVYGVTGCGKTFLAERISAATGIPWHSVDDLTWEPGWVLVPEEEQRRRIEVICAGDRWVLDTAYGTWLDGPLARADLVLALDYPRWLSLSRLLRRSIARAIDGRPICNGNRESFRNLLGRNSIVIWHFRRSSASAIGCERGRRTLGCRRSSGSPGRARSSVGSGRSRRQASCSSPSPTQARSSSDCTNEASSASARASTSSADAPARSPAYR